MAFDMLNKVFLLFPHKCTHNCGRICIYVLVYVNGYEHKNVW